MSSTPNFGGHLDANSGREVVFCHNCQNEWYHDEHGLRCPNCGCEVTEIIENDDPRHGHAHDEYDAPDMAGHPFGIHGHSHSHSHAQDYHSDPEEGDIEEHVHHGPNGFFVHRRVMHPPGSDHSSPGPFDPRHGNRADPGDANAILRRFEEMLVHDFRAGATGRSGREDLFPRQHGYIQAGGSAGGPRIHRTVFTTPGGGGTTSFTIATGPINARGGGPPVNFGEMFNLMMGDVQPPNARMGEGSNQGGMPHNFPETLQQILAAVLNPVNAVHGDAVFSQQALDQVITQLMEAHPQSNAAPPASQNAIDKLERKPLDSKLVGSEGQECAVCMDTMHQGDEALFLPCKHWFHDECVVTWLKEHGTCPVCRHAVDENATPPPSNAPPPSDSAPGGPQAQPAGAPRAAADEIPHHPRSRPWRTRSDNQERLNSIRDIADAPSYRQDSRRAPYTTSSSAGPRGAHGSADTSRDRMRSRSPGAGRPSHASGDHDRGRYDQQPEHAGGSGGQGFMGFLRDWTGRGSGSEQPPRDGRQ